MKNISPFFFLLVATFFCSSSSLAFASQAGQFQMNEAGGGIEGEDPQINHTSAEGGGCRRTDIVGRYGFLWSGNTVGAGSATPYSSGGVITFRRNGTFSITGTQSDDGVVTPISSTEGTFTLNKDCRGTGTIAGQPLFQFVSVGHGEQLNFIRSDIGVVITGFAKRVASGCTLGNVRGTYGYAFNAMVFNIPINNTIIPQALFAGGGSVRVEAGTNGQNLAVLDDLASFGGFVLPRHYEGVVSVGSDCTGTAVVTLPPNAPTSANPVHINAVWVDARRSVLLIQTDPGTFIAGEAKKILRLRR